MNCWKCSKATAFFEISTYTAGNSNCLGDVEQLRNERELSEKAQRGKGFIMKADTKKGKEKRGSYRKAMPRKGKRNGKGFILEENTKTGKRKGNCNGRTA